jgi:hypothetical protein
VSKLYSGKIFTETKEVLVFDIVSKEILDSLVRHDFDGFLAELEELEGQQ